VRQVQERRWGRGVGQTAGQRCCALDLVHSDCAWADIDRGIDEDDQIRSGNAFGQLWRELMANNRADGAHGRALVVRKCTGDSRTDAIIAPQWIAIADDEGCCDQDRLPQARMIARRAIRRRARREIVRAPLRAGP
jgi:hypothetical protein